MCAKRITSQDVARRAGVSRTTVSLVLNDVREIQISDETRRRVLEAANELNYHPDASARRLVQGRTQVIGFVERHAPAQTFADAFLADVLRGLHQVAKQRGYYVLFEPYSSHNNHQDRYIQLIQERHADGIVLSGPRFDDQNLLELHRQGVPIVLNGQLPGSNIPCVDVDNVGGARLATEHIILLGHRRIGMITNGPLVYTAATDRKAGYMIALQEAGLSLDRSLIQTGYFSPQSGYQAMQNLLAVEAPPSAVFVASDTVAIGALEAIKDAGLRIPGDIAIVGFDDIPWAAHFDPPLTTVRLPAFDLGWKAGERLIRLLNGELLEQAKLLLDTELIVRKSCGSSAH